MFATLDELFDTLRTEFHEDVPTDNVSSTGSNTGFTRIGDDDHA